MSEFTFSDTMAEISLEVSEREIYNDIRSEVNVTETETIIDQRAEYATALFYSDTLYLAPLELISYMILYSPRPVVKWIEAFPVNVRGGKSMDTEAECSAINGEWRPPYYLPSGALIKGFCDYSNNRHVRVTIMSNAYNDKIYLNVANRINYSLRCEIAVRYRYLVQPEQYHEETRTYTVKIRKQNSSSISKYGRRVMNLVWPLGQSKEEMEATIGAYLERYKEPMPQIAMKIQGTTEELIEQILTRKISDCVTIKNTAMGMPEVDFFINSATITQTTGDLLEATWGLEQARDMELVSLFTWDVSFWDGGDVWAY